ncbi:MAG TPA: YjbH domain-containing protein, partial [Azospirillaceae bacterium]|nr:YjbH domain-containing protein [Azospirillaceae bacterium]
MRTAGLVLAAGVLATAIFPPAACGGELGSSRNDYGGIGLIQTPTARVAPEGTVTAGATEVGRHTHLYVSAQPFSGLEITARQTAKTHILGFIERLDGGIDVKLRLRREDENGPEVAIGARGLVGTGALAGEYLVLNRRVWNADLSLGLGWGRLAGDGDLPNPAGWLDDRFVAPRNALVNGPGTWFTGRKVGLFGGIEVHATTIENLSVKMEASADHLQGEDPDPHPNTPFNLAVVWRPWPWLDLSAGLEQGKWWMLRAVASTDLGSLPAPKPAPPRPVGPRPAPPPRSPEAAVLGAIAWEGIPTRAVDVGPTRATVWLADTPEPAARTVGRAARALADTAPAEVEELTVVTGKAGLAGPGVSLMRGDLERAERGHGSPEEIFLRARFEPPPSVPDPPAALPSRHAPPLAFGLVPRQEVSLTEPAISVARRTTLDAEASLASGRGVIFDTALRANLSSNLALMPRMPTAEPVRSDIADFAREGTVALARLTASALATLSPGLHARLTLGQIEEMYGGVGGELLFRPYGARWAVGGDLHHVYKRLPGHSLEWTGEGATTG